MEFRVFVLIKITLPRNKSRCFYKNFENYFKRILNLLSTFLMLVYLYPNRVFIALLRVKYINKRIVKKWDSSIKKKIITQKFSNSYIFKGHKTQKKKQNKTCEKA